MAGLCDDLLAQQRSATTFDEVQFRAYFVGAVNGQINLAGDIAPEHGNPQPLRHGSRRSRCWHAHNVVKQPSRNSCPIRRVAYIAVLPVPSPTTMPELTNWVALSAACCLYCSIVDTTAPSMNIAARTGTPMDGL